MGCSSHSAERQPYPRIQLPRRGCARTRSSASARPAAPSSFTSRCESDQVGKWTCESVKPGRTQRPPRSTTSGLGKASSCVPTPPATCAPAIASARVVGSVGSIVRMTPFSRIMRGDCIEGRERNGRARRCECGGVGPGEAVLRRAPRNARIPGRVRGGRARSPTSPTTGGSTSESDAATRSAARTWPSPARIADSVDRFHEVGLAAGGTDNGAPGIRAQYDANYYAAYVLDPDGNNIEGVCHKAPT